MQSCRKIWLGNGGGRVTKFWLRTIFRDGLNLLDRYNDNELYNRYCFTRQSILEIAGLIVEDLKTPTEPNCLSILIFRE
uniref:Uncharacterized protein n=1 Tax=Romanomermis culicivorax TaxID=13658 RepID=A0A915JRD0_ROMCU